MKQVVYKYVLERPGYTSIKVPYYSQFLSVKMLNDQISFWFLVDTAKAHPTKETYGVIAVNTGDPFALPPGYKFLNTIVSSNGTVWHIFMEHE
jgi:hypothetical protein